MRAGYPEAFAGLVTALVFKTGEASEKALGGFDSHPLPLPSPIRTTPARNTSGTAERNPLHSLTSTVAGCDQSTCKKRVANNHLDGSLSLDVPEANTG